jgi:hypothetical protein
MNGTGTKLLLAGIKTKGKEKEENKNYFVKYFPGLHSSWNITKSTTGKTKSQFYLSRAINLFERDQLLNCNYQNVQCREFRTTNFCQSVTTLLVLNLLIYIRLLISSGCFFKPQQCANPCAIVEMLFVPSTDKIM